MKIPSKYSLWVARYDPKFNHHYNPSRQMCILYIYIHNIESSNCIFILYIYSSSVMKKTISLSVARSFSPGASVSSSSTGSLPEILFCWVCKGFEFLGTSGMPFISIHGGLAYGNMVYGCLWVVPPYPTDISNSLWMIPSIKECCYDHPHQGIV